MAYIYDLTDTWNASGTTFNGIKLNVTDSASASSSKLVTLQTNGTEHFSITKAGVGYVSGNLGVGTSSPGAKLDVATASGDCIIRVGNGTSQARFAVDNDGPYIYPLTSGDLSLRVFTPTGSEAMRIDSSGNVGIGATTTNGKLTIKNPSASGDQVIFNVQAATSTTSIGRVSYNQTDDTMRLFNESNFAGSALLFGVNNTERMRIDYSGNVGIGTTAPKSRFQASGGAIFDAPTLGSATNAPFYVTNPDPGYGLVVGVNGADGHTFLQAQRTDGSATPYSITLNEAGGNVLVGTTSSAYSAALAKFSVEGGSSAASVLANTGGASYGVLYVYNKSTSGNNEFIGFGTEGTWTARGSISYNRGAGLTAYNTTSDYRAKDILGPVTDAGATIDALNVYSGKMKGATSARPMLIAHEAQEVTPYAVTGEKDAVNEDGSPKLQQMDVSSLVPLLIAEVQSLRARVAQLEGN